MLSLRPVNLLFSSLVMLSSIIIMLITRATQEAVAGVIKEAKDRQRQVRQCEYPACEVKATDGATLHKCPGCRVALYCDKSHAILHMLEHESFCIELTRTCDYPGCEERAEITCSECGVAMYCYGKKHMRKHRAAHESVCEELCA